MSVSRSRGTKLLLAGAFGVGVTVAGVQGGDLDNWALTNSLPRIANHLFSVRSGAGSVGRGNLIVGDFGLAILDGLRVGFSTPTDRALLDAAYSDGIWLAVGDYGTIVAGAPTNSTFGALAWTNVPSGTSAVLTGIAFGAGRWVVVGDAGTILTSTNHIDWQSAPSPTAKLLRGVGYFGGSWVAVGGDVLDGILLTSTNAVDWVEQDTPAVMYGVAGFSGGWVAVGEFGTILRSTNGLDWLQVSSGTASTLRAVAAFGTNLFWKFSAPAIVTVGDGGTILQSQGGQLWTPVKSNTASDLYGVTAEMVGDYYDWEAVGSDGAILRWSLGSSVVPLPFDNSAAQAVVNAVATGNTQWVAVGATVAQPTGIPSWVPAGFALLSSDAVNWRPVLVKPGEGFHDVQHANGRWIVVGTNANGGFIRTSTNGVDWPEQNLGPSIPGLHGVAASTDRWIAVGDRELILTSSNGLEWTEMASGTTNSLRAVGYNGTRWVAVGDHGTVLVSNDGVIWEVRTSGTSNQLLDIAYGAGRWIASGTAVVLSSADTLAWNPTPFNGTFGHVRFQDGLWVTWTDGLLLTSYDGLQWMTHPLFNGASIVFNVGTGLWEAIGNGSVWQSMRFWLDSLTVSQQSNSHLFDISFRFGTFTVPSARIDLSLLGSGQTSIVLSATSLVTSDGVGTNVVSGAYHVVWDAAASLPPETYLPTATLQLTATTPGNSTALWSAPFPIDLRTFVDPWFVRQGPTNTDNLLSVTYGNGQWVALGGSTVLTSTDAVSWTRRNAGVSNLVAGGGYHNGTWLAVSRSDAWTSADAIHWADWPNISSNWLWAVGYGTGQWVATGANGGVLVSSTGTNWVQTSSGAGSALVGIDYGNGLWVAVGYVALVTSTDAIHWTNQPPAISAWQSAVRFRNNHWVAVGFNESILTSADGISWTAVPSGVSAPLQSVDYGDGLWVAVGDSGAMVSSPDGIHWTVRQSGTTVNLQSVAYGNWRWVAVGDGGIILSTDTVRPAVDLTLHPSRREPDGSLVLGATAVPGESYRLQATTNLVDWLTVTNFIPTTNDFELTDTQTGQSPHRFYRLVSP